MPNRPSRAKMCNWLASALRGVRTRPSNPADLALMSQLSIEADRKIRRLTSIASELGWHADSDLDLAWELIQEYDEQYCPREGPTGDTDER